MFLSSKKIRELVEAKPERKEKAITRAEKMIASCKEGLPRHTPGSSDERFLTASITEWEELLDWLNEK